MTLDEIDALMAQGRQRLAPLEVSSEDREAAMVQGEVGTYPGDEHVTDRFLKSGRQEFDTLKTDRFKLTEQVHKARVEDQAFKDRESLWGQTKQFANDLLAPHDLMRNVKQAVPVPTDDVVQPAPNLFAPGITGRLDAQLAKRAGQDIPARLAELTEERDRLVGLYPHLTAPIDTRSYPNGRQVSMPPRLSPEDEEALQRYDQKAYEYNSLAGPSKQQPILGRSMDERPHDPQDPTDRYKSAEPYRPLSLGEAFEESGKAFMRSVGGTTALALKSIGTMSYEIDQAMGPTEVSGKKVDDYGMFQAGKRLSEMTERMFPGRKDLQDNFLLTTIPQAFGSSVPFYATAALGAVAGVNAGVAAAITGAMVGAESLYEKGTKLGVDPEKKRIGLLFGGLLGATEGVPIADLFKRMDLATGGSLTGALKVGTVQAIEEAVQEGFQQLGENATVKYLFGKDQELSEDVASGMGVGGFVGFFTGAIMARKQRYGSTLDKEQDQPGSSRIPNPDEVMSGPAKTSASVANSPFAEAPAKKPAAPMEPQASPRQPNVNPSGIHQELNIAQRPPFLMQQQPSPVAPGLPPAMVPTSPGQAPVPLSNEGGRPVTPTTSEGLISPELVVPGQMQAQAEPQMPPDAGIPFFIGTPQRQALYDLGYRRADVDSMKPADAVAIIEAQRTAQPTIPPLPPASVPEMEHPSIVPATQDVTPEAITAGADLTETDRDQRFTGLLNLAADEPSYLRESDVDRIMSEATESDRENFRDWLLGQDLTPRTHAAVQAWTPEPVTPTDVTPTAAVPATEYIVQSLRPGSTPETMTLETKPTTAPIRKNISKLLGELHGRSQSFDPTVEGRAESEALLARAQAVDQGTDEITAEQRQALRQNISHLKAKLHGGHRGPKPSMMPDELIAEKPKRPSDQAMEAIADYDAKTFDYTVKGKRPKVKQIIKDWKAAGSPKDFNVIYGETEGHFYHGTMGNSSPRWLDDGNGALGFSRSEIVKALEAESRQAETPTGVVEKPQPASQPKPETPTDVAAHEAATSPTNGLPQPTQGQKEAGNYAKGHVTIAGLDISIENPEGSTRSGTDANGKPWSITMQDHYGYILGTTGKDKDHLDVFIKPGTPENYSGPVFVVDQNKPGTKTFDEHKIVLGVKTSSEARALYNSNYAKDWKGLASLSTFTMPQFKEWLQSGDHTQPAGRYTIPQEQPIGVTPTEAVASPPAKSGTIHQTPTPGEVIHADKRPATNTVGAPDEAAPAGVPSEGVSRPPASGDAQRPHSGDRGSSGGGIQRPPQLRPPIRPSIREDSGPDLSQPGTMVEPKAPAGRDYVITPEDKIEEGGPKAKFRKNVAAIRLVKKLDAEGRLATEEEQSVLVKYTGWGGVKNAFSEEDESWQKEADELRALLTPEEYATARKSIQYAHYTDPRTIGAIWKALQHMGLTKGSILEPGMGTGNFFGATPKALAKSLARSGVEMDYLSGRIAQQLYQRANIQIVPFQETTLPDNHFDVAVGNVPFSEVKIADPKDKTINNLRLSLHNYFFAKALQKVRPGGIVAFITSTGTMDNKNGRAREYFASHADLIAAYRLPSGVFKGIANTDVVTDIVILRKRQEGESPSGPAWKGIDEYSRNTGTFRINEYFVAHPEHILGEMRNEGTMYRDESMTVIGDADVAIGKLESLTDALPAGLLSHTPPASTSQSSLANALMAPLDVKAGAFFVQDNQLFTKVGDRLIPHEPRTTTAKARILGLVPVRDALKHVFVTQLRGDSELEIARAQTALNTHYDAFVKDYGLINSRANRLAYGQDPDYPVLQSLEKDYDPDTNTAKKADVFSKRTIENQKAITTADSPQSALAIVLNESNTVDFDRMHELTGHPVAELQASLRGLVYQDPATDTWETASAYLSGNVRAKLAVAQEAVKKNPDLAMNVEALLSVQPKDLLPSQIDARLGAGWIPASDVKDFIQSILNTKYGTVRYSAGQGLWQVDAFPEWGVEATQTHGTMRMSAPTLIEMGLNSQVPKVYDTIDDKRVVNEQETLAAREKLDGIKAAFTAWLWRDDARAHRLADDYNQHSNNTVQTKHDGSHLIIPGKNPAITLRPAQLNTVYRALQHSNTLVAHEVGTGKTYTLATIAMEARRLGIAKKPMIVVPNHIVGQWDSEMRTLFPGANVLMTTKKDFEKENRRKLMGKIATGDWDAVVVPFTSFTMLPISKDTFIGFMKDQIAILEEYIRAERESQNDHSKIVKDLEKAKERFEEKIKSRMASTQYDDAVNFEETGVDMLLVDESDLFKNLYFPTRMTRVSGLPNTHSKRAFDMYMKTRYITKLNHGRGVIFATGTPISNSMAEVFTMQRYLQQDTLEAAGLGHFDAWARMFGEAVSSIEMTASGKYQMKTRFANFINVPELMQMFHQVMDVVTADEAKVERPPMKTGKPINVVSTPGPALRAYVDSLDVRTGNLKNVDPRQDNMLKITGDGRHAALDVRLRVPGAPEDKDSKINKLVKQAAEVYHRTTPVKGTQLIFLDLSTPKAKDSKQAKAQESDEAMPQEEEVETSSEVLEREGVYGMIRQKLLALGVKAHEIAYVHDAKTDKQKATLFASVNKGVTRILLGSTERMGAGTNVQQRLVASHDGDAPWRPRDLEQRHGRIHRFGNWLFNFSKVLAKKEAGTPLSDNERELYAEFKGSGDLLKDFHIEIYQYATEAPSFDVYMWQTLESKAKVIAQIMKGDPNIRTIQDVDAATMNASEMKALASGNPMVIEKVGVDADVRRYSVLKSAYQDAQYFMRRELALEKSSIDRNEGVTKKAKSDIAWLQSHPADPFTLKIGKQSFDDKTEAGDALISALEALTVLPEYTEIGKYRGFKLTGRKLVYKGMNPDGVAYEVSEYKTVMTREGGGLTYEAGGKTPSGLLRSLDNALGKSEDFEANNARANERHQKDILKLERELAKPFEYEERLDKLLVRQKEINTALMPVKDDPSKVTDISVNEEELPDEQADESEGPDVAMMRVGGDGNENRAAAGMDPRIMKVLGGNLYSGDLGEIAVKEMLQNAVDGLRELPDGGRSGRIDVEIDTKARTIKVSDTGVGMSTDVATKELLDIGGSKKGEGSSGGFGIAKVAIFSNAERILIETRHKDANGDMMLTRLSGSGDEWMDQSRGLEVDTQRTSQDSGTTMTITLNDDVKSDAYNVRTWLQTFLSTNRLPMDIAIRMNGAGITGTHEALTQPMNPWFFQGGTINTYVGNEIASYPRGYVEAQILNHGLPQFVSTIWLGGEKYMMPKTIIMDIQSKSGPEEADYPFTPDRERLRKHALKAIEAIGSKMAQSSQKSESDKFVLAMDTAPSVPGTRYKVFDTASNHSAETVRALAEKPYIQRLSAALGQVFTEIQDALKSVHPKMETVELGGIGLGDSYLGVNILGPSIEAGRTNNVILLNPFTILKEVQQATHAITPQHDETEEPAEFAKQMILTIIHELSHQQSRAHAEEFAGALTRNAGKAIMVSAKATQALQRAITENPEAETPTGAVSFLKGRRQDETIITQLAKDLSDLHQAWAKRKDLFADISIRHAKDDLPHRHSGRAEDGGQQRSRPRTGLSGGRRAQTETLGSGADLSADHGDVAYQDEARQYRLQRAAEERGFTSSDEEVEARVRAAKQGVKPESLWSKLKAHREHVWHLVTREYEHLPDTAQFSPLRTDLLRLQKYKGIAADQVQRDLAAIIKPLSRKQYDQFEWKALLADLSREAEQDRALPFGYTPEKVQEDLDRLNEVIDRDPVVRAAWEKRQALWASLKKDYQKSMDAIGFDTSKKLTKEDYFRHQVLEYARERHLKGTGSKVRTPTGRGFLRARHGSGMDINANYVQAEFEVMAQMVYDTQVAKVVAGVDTHYNIREQLAAEAKTRNKEAIQDIIDQGGMHGEVVEGEMKRFSQRIGMHMGRIREALELDKTDRLTMEQIQELANDPESPANLSARGVFKAIGERKAYVKELLGKKFATWESLVPDTHDLWQPREGNVFYMVDSIPAQMAKALHEGMMAEAGLTPDMLRKVMAMGNEREQYVIPKEAKATLEDLSHKEHSWFVEMNRHVLGHWKQLMLIAPRKVLRYNLRNLTGDADAMFVGNPSAFKKLPTAAKELIPVIFKDTVLTGEAKEWANRGGYGTTLQMQELGELNDLKAFQASLDRESKGGWLKAPAAAWNTYWQTARLATDYREGLMRYAAYLDYLEQMQASATGRPTNFGASIPETVMALRDLRDRAFKMSNELLGAYDRVSVAGQTVRSFWIPFWSWQEVNATRYTQLMRNAVESGDTVGLLRGAAVTGKGAATFLIKAAFFWSMLQAWNFGMYGDDEDDLRDTNPTVASRPHILMGRGEDGKIRYLAGIGALGDLLSWFGLDSFPGLVGDLMHDRMTLGEAIKHAAKSPVNKILQGLMPVVKMPLELAVRESTYPDIFNPRPIQDRTDYLANQFTVGPEIQAIRGKPGKPLYGSEDLTGLLVQRTDPKGGAYSTWQGIEKKYLERMGKESSAVFWRSPRGEALSNWSRAIQNHDGKAETHWKNEYEQMERAKMGHHFSQTAMMNDIEKSLRAKAPLAGVTKAERDSIVKGLDSQERRTLAKAEDYYRESLLLVLPEARRRTFERKMEGQKWLSRKYQPVLPHEIAP